MNKIEILGGKPLQGVVTIQGSKNAVLPILSASVLNKGITVLHGCPKILDVIYMIEILKEIGCYIKWNEESLIIDASTIISGVISKEYAQKMRSSVILFGSLLARKGEASIVYPGGCIIGGRPIDLHIMALKKLNATIEEKNERIMGCTKELRGNEIYFPFSSVGATENALLAAVLAKGTTCIHTAAKEPEIQILCSFLRKMGADISGDGTDCIIVNGVKELQDIEYKIPSDRIVAGTYLLAAVATRGKILLRKAPTEHINECLKVVEQLGARIFLLGEGLWINAQEATKSIEYLETNPYPGFPTDLQSQMMAVLAIADGESRLKENIFDGRFRLADELNKMGADIRIQGNEAVIHGVEKLKGGNVWAQDLRGGAALAIAGLAAEERTIVHDIGHIQRGYLDICKDLTELGADIRYS